MAGGSPNSSASRYSSETCCSAATTRFQDASSAPESGAGGGGAGREHPDETRSATSSRSPVRFIRGRDYPRMLRPAASAGRRRSPLLRVAGSGLLRGRLQTESLEDLGRLLLDDLLVLRPHPEEVLLHRPERLEMGVFELVDGTRLRDLDRTFHERRADEPAEGLPGEVVDVPLRVPERVVGGGQDRTERLHGGGELARVYRSDDLPEPVVARVAPFIDLAARGGEPRGRGQEGERLARAAILGEVVRDLHPALEEVPLAEVLAQGGRNVRQLTTYARIALLGRRQRRVRGLGGLLFRDGWRRRLRGRLGRAEGEVGSDGRADQREADEQQWRALAGRGIRIVGHGRTVTPPASRCTWNRAGSFDLKRLARCPFSSRASLPLTPPRRAPPKAAASSASAPPAADCASPRWQRSRAAGSDRRGAGGSPPPAPRPGFPSARPLGGAAA